VPNGVAQMFPSAEILMGRRGIDEARIAATNSDLPPF
jgi:hypothetical protein